LQIANFKLKPFVGARVCFFGFPEDEKRHMCEVLQQQGGEPTEIADPNCTHVVSVKYFFFLKYFIIIYERDTSYNDLNPLYFQLNLFTNFFFNTISILYSFTLLPNF
jgi:hypothetical protein